MITNSFSAGVWDEKSENGNNMGPSTSAERSWQGVVHLGSVSLIKMDKEKVNQRESGLL